MIEKKYKYSGRWLMILIGVLMFGACTILFYYKSIHNNQGLIINSIIELKVAGATIFYWVFFSLSLLMTLMGVYGLYVKIKGDKYLIIDDTKITIPPVGFQRKLKEIPFNKLDKVSEAKINGNFILTLYYENEKGNITSSLVSNKKEYEEIKTFIQKRMYK